MSGWVSVTAEGGSVTAPLPRRATRGTVPSRQLLDHQRPAERFVEHRPQRLVRLGQQGVLRINVDCADDGCHRTDMSRLASSEDNLIQQLADAPDAGRARSPFEPRHVIGIEGDRDRLLGHMMFIRYSLTLVEVKRRKATDATLERKGPAFARTASGELRS